MNEKTRFVKVPELDYDLIIVDEASMISARLLDDLESYGKKVLLVGDHGQLEPIGSNPKVMLHPDVRLEQIHRQAAGSSIIKFAHVLREGRNPAQWVGVDRESVHIRPGFPDDPAAFDVVICGFNKTRVRLNRQIREDRGFSGSRPVEGEWVICLRNNHDMGVFNGQRFRVVGVKETAGLHTLSLVDEDDAKFKDIPYAPEQFGRESTDLTINRSKCLFDWGYALTAHKSQGSEWDRVAVIEEIGQSWSAARWRYTASTRAAKELHYYV